MAAPVRLTPGFVAACCILLFSTIAPALEIDDAVFLNYVNNVERRPLLFYYNGYVALIPELTAALLSPLPLVYQALLYRLPPLIGMLLLYREMRRLLAFTGVEHGSWLALAILMVLGAVVPSLWANVALTQWLALLIAACYVTRINAGGGRYSPFGAAAVIFAALAAPPGIILSGLMVVHALTKVAPLRTQLLLAAAIALPLVVVTLGDRELQVNTNPLAAPFDYFASFRAYRPDRGYGAYKLANLIVAGSLVTLALVCWWMWRRRDELGARPSVSVVCLSLAFVGWASIAFYVMSDRFESNQGGFERHYAVPVLCCALLALATALHTLRQPDSRHMLIGAMLGASVMVVCAATYTELRGPLEYALMKYRFLQIAEAACAGGAPDELFVFEDDSSSPVVACRRLPTSTSNLFLTGFIPSVGSYDPDPSEFEGRPLILGPKPLFP